MADKLNVVEMLFAEPRFAIFVKGLKTTGLIAELNQTGPFTILAPSNLAFTRLPEARLIELMKPINTANLREIMKYHVIAGKLMSEDIARLTMIITLQDQRVRIEATNLDFKVNGANLQTRNVEAANGVIHGINAVLFPAIATEAV